MGEGANLRITYVDETREATVTKVLFRKYLITERLIHNKILKLQIKSKHSRLFKLGHLSFQQ